MEAQYRSRVNDEVDLGEVATVLQGSREPDCHTGGLRHERKEQHHESNAFRMDGPYSALDTDVDGRFL